MVCIFIINQESKDAKMTFFVHSQATLCYPNDIKYYGAQQRETVTAG